MEIKPLQDHLFVELFDYQEYSSIIDTPEHAKFWDPRAKVLAVGPGIINEDGDLIPTQCQGDEIVVVPLQKGVDYEIGEKRYKLIRESEVFLVDETQETG